MRTRYVYDPESGKLVPKSEMLARRGFTLPDISEFVTIDGVRIGSRSALREYQRATGMEQIGNDTVNGKDESGQYQTKPTPMPDIEPVIREAWQKHNA